MISDLQKAGQLVSSYEIPGTGATKTGRNGHGDPYFTDGEALVGVLRRPHRQFNRETGEWNGATTEQGDCPSWSSQWYFM